MANEIEELYNKIIDGEDVDEVPAALNYYDYVRGIMEWIDTPKGQAAREYWRAKLTGMPGTPLLDDELLSGHMREDDRPLFYVPAETVTKINEACSSVNCTLIMALLAAQFSAFQRMTSSDDFTIWSFREGRSDNALAGVLGMLVDDIPYRVILPTGASMHEVLKIVKDAVLEAEEHIPYPSALIRELLNESGANLQGPNLNFVPPASQGVDGEGPARAQNRWTPFALEAPPRDALTRISLSTHIRIRFV